MAVLNGNRAFAARKEKTQPVMKIPKTVRQALNIDKAFKNGVFKIEPKKKQALYDSCYLFEDINYINKNKNEQKSFLLELMEWLNSMNVNFKITLANQYQSMDEFLKSIRAEKNEDTYPDIAEGIHRWQEDSLEEANLNVTTIRYLVVTAKADTQENARIYLNALENTVMDAFAIWGSRIVKLDARERLRALQAVMQPGRPEEQDYISFPGEAPETRSWQNDILPWGIRQYRNFMVMGDTYVSVLYGAKYRKSIDSDTFVRALTNLAYPSVLTMDFAPVETDIVNDKLAAVQMNNEQAIAAEMDQKRKANLIVTQPSYSKKRRKEDIESYIDQVDDNDEKGYFMNLLMVVTAETEDLLAERVQEIKETGRTEGCIFQTCDYRQLKAWNTALPVGGRQVDYMRFFLSSSLVAFQPYHAQDIIEPGGHMLGMNRTTKRFVVGNRKTLPNPHGIIIGFSGTGKSMMIKLTDIAQTLVSTDDDILVIDPQNEFESIINSYHGVYYDLTPKSGIYLNGFEVSAEVFGSDPKVKRQFVAKQTEYAKSLCAAAMKNIEVTQEHGSVISRCTERMFEQVFAQKKLKRQPTLAWLRGEIKKDLEQASNEHDEGIIRPIYNCLEEYTLGSCDMLAHPSNIEIHSRLVGFGMVNIPENNWEAVMVTILHYLSARMDYNKKLQKATQLIVDETQVVSKKPGSAEMLNNAVITFRKFGGIVTMAMQNVTAALANPTLTEMFQNCSYKCFLDQGGVDAQSLAAIQELSAKEYKALESGREGEGIIVCNKKVILFSARIRKDNPLYESFSTNFHEKAKHKTDLLPENKPLAVTEERPMEEENRMAEQMVKNKYQQLLEIAELSPIDVLDVMQICHMGRPEAEALLLMLVNKNLLRTDGREGRYRKVG